LIAKIASSISLVEVFAEAAVTSDDLGLRAGTRG